MKETKQQCEAKVYDSRGFFSSRCLRNSVSIDETGRNFCKIHSGYWVNPRTLKKELEKQKKETYKEEKIKKLVDDFYLTLKEKFDIEAPVHEFVSKLRKIL